MILTTYTLLLICFAIRPSVTDDSVDLCSNEKCIRKCCEHGSSYHYRGYSDDGEFIGGCKKDKYATNFSIPIYEQDTKVGDLFTGFKIGTINCTNLVVTKWYPECSENTIYLQRGGNFYFTGIKKSVDLGEYCVDARNGIPTYYYCSTENLEGVHSFISTVEIIPIPFLLLTFLVYASLPEWNIHRKAVMAHTLFLAVGYILLDVTNLYEIENNTSCLVAGYLTMFCFFTSDIWMNIMWIDIWLGFGGMQGLKKRLSKHSLFNRFCIYAFGVNGLCILMYALYSTVTSTGKYCPFETGNACYRRVYSFVYNIIFITIMSLFNIVLFVLITINMRRIKREPALVKNASERHTSKNDKKYTIYWILVCFLIFNPLSAIQEIISNVAWLNSDVYISFATIITGFYGPLVFILFVCRKSIWLELREKYYQYGENPKPNASFSALSKESSSESMIPKLNLKV